MILDIQWPLHFFPETDFVYNDLQNVQKMNKKWAWEVKKNSRLLSTGHRILPSDLILWLQGAWNYGR